MKGSPEHTGCATACRDPCSRASKRDPPGFMTFSVCPLDIFCSSGFSRSVQRRKLRKRCSGPSPGAVLVNDGTGTVCWVSQGHVHLPHPEGAAPAYHHCNRTCPHLCTSGPSECPLGTGRQLLFWPCCWSSVDTSLLCLCFLVCPGKVFLS